MDRRVKHRFQIHHILPNQIFETERLSKPLKEIFGNDYLTLRDSETNKIALYRDMQQAATIKQSLLNGDNFYRDMGMGGSHHEGGHKGYNLFLLQNIESILKTPEDTLNTEQKKIAFFDLARFASQVSEGTATHDGKPLSLAGGKANAETLEDAWAARRLDYTASDVLTQDGLGDFINRSQSPDHAITDAITNGTRNTEQRLLVTQKQTTAFYQRGVISEKHFHRRMEALNEISESMKHLSPREIQGGIISRVFFSNSIDMETANKQSPHLLKVADQNEASQLSAHHTNHGQRQSPLSSVVVSTAKTSQENLDQHSPEATQDNFPEAAPPVLKSSPAGRRPK